MPATPRTQQEILQGLIARLVATSVLDDVAEGGVAASLMGAISEDIAFVEQRVYDLYRAWLFRSRGEDLDLVVRGLPLQFSPRRGASPATGGAFTVLRASSGTELVVPAGELRAVDPASPEVAYTNPVPLTFSVGQASISTVGGDPISFIATTPGEAGNRGTGRVNQLTQGFADVWGVINSSPLGGGTDTESDDSVQSRALRWIVELGKVQGLALEARVRNFTDSAGRAATHVTAVTFPNIPGYTEIVVDDGNAFQGFVRPGEVLSGTVPELVGGGRYTFWFESPAVTAPRLRISRPSTGSTTHYFGETPGLVVHHEEGAMWTTPGTAGAPDIRPGDLWQASGYNVYDGFIAEAQAHIADRVPSGLRHRVVPATPQQITISGTVLAAPGFQPAGVRLRTRDAIIAWFRTLAPGEPFFVHVLHDAIAGTPGLRNIVFDQSDKYPGSPRNRFIPHVMLR